MRQTAWMTLSLLGPVLAFATGLARGGPVGRVPPEAADRAVSSGVKYLWSKQQANGSWAPYVYKESRFPVGPTALAVYALLETGIDVGDPRVAKALRWLARQETTKTYSLALRANAYLLAERQVPGRYRDLLQKDVQALVGGMRKGGGFTYDVGDQRESVLEDNSNTQMALLGVWAGKRAGLDVPLAFWEKSLRHWRFRQTTSGGWDYRQAAPPRHPMTAAGLVSVMLCYQNLDNVKRDATCLKKGLDWLASDFKDSLRKTSWPGYYAFALARLGLVSGDRKIGGHDWYELCARHLVASQASTGNWSKPPAAVPETALSLLFFALARRPVLLHKLDIGSDPNAAHADVVNMTRWMNNHENARARCRVVARDAPLADWLEAPILYITGTHDPKFTVKEFSQLREFVRQGGTIFSTAVVPGANFSRMVREAYVAMFPEYGLLPVPQLHSIYSSRTRFPLRAAKRKFYVMSNGVRPLIVHTNQDLSTDWRKMESSRSAAPFRTGANVIHYTTGWLGSLDEPGVGSRLGPYTGKYQHTVTLAILKHPANCQPEPGAHRRLALLMAHRTQTKINLVGPIEIKRLADTGAAIATLTGTKAITLSAGDRDTLKAFVAAGGTLVVDAAGGAKRFSASAEKMLKNIFGASALAPLPPDAAVYRLKGYEIGKVRYRPKTHKRLAVQAAPRIRGVTVGGRVGVFFSREDLTAALANRHAFPIDGYAPESAYDLMRNIVLLSLPRAASSP